ISEVGVVLSANAEDFCWSLAAGGLAARFVRGLSEPLMIMSQTEPAVLRRVHTVCDLARAEAPTILRVGDFCVLATTRLVVMVGAQLGYRRRSVAFPDGTPRQSRGLVDPGVVMPLAEAQRYRGLSAALELARLSDIPMTVLWSDTPWTARRPRPHVVHLAIASRLADPTAAGNRAV